MSYHYRAIPFEGEPEEVESIEVIEEDTEKWRAARNDGTTREYPKSKYRIFQYRGMDRIVRSR